MSSSGVAERKDAIVTHYWKGPTAIRRREHGCMAAMSDDTATPTPDEIRRSELIARVNEHNSPRGPMNPYALGLGWVGFVILAIGVIVFLVGASNAQSFDGDVHYDNGFGEAVVGGCFAAFGTMTLVILLTFQAVNWQLRRQASSLASSATEASSSTTSNG